MKFFKLGFLVLCTFNTLSYGAQKYANIHGLRGKELKTFLKETLKLHHRPRPYADLFNAYFESDLDLDDDADGSIRDIYSESPGKADRYTYSRHSQKCGNYKKEADCFNREHLFPQSIFRKALPMRSDFFHVFPTDGKVNQMRDHFPFGEVSRAIWTSKNGSLLGEGNSGPRGQKLFEPIDEFKGDVARALLYFAVRYEDYIVRWSDETLSNDPYLFYQDWYLETLKRWHQLDPVSPHERRRNDYGESFQGNRNPFIDYPEYVEAIW